MLKLPLWIANVLSPNGKVKKQSLYSRHPKAWNMKFVCSMASYSKWFVPTHISDLVVIDLPQYISTISGDL